MSDIIPNDIDRLLAQLNKTGLQQSDNNLYQVIKQLIGSLALVNRAGGAAISNAIGSNKSIVSGISIPGMDGIDGIDAPFIPGPTGMQGPPGVSGFDGRDGEDALILIPGPQGIQGIQGVQGPAGTDLSLIQVSLSEGQIESWNTSPIQLVAAQGATKIIFPIHLSIQITIVSSYSTAPTMDVFWGTDTNQLTATMSSTLTSAAQTSIQTVNARQLSPTVYTTVDPRNKALNFKGSTDPGTPLTGVATAIINLLYLVATTN